MPVLIVGAERNISQLKSRLFRGRISRAASTKVTEALRAANPHIDLDHLEPGTIVTVPDLPEIDVRGELSIDEITKNLIEEVSGNFDTALASIEAVASDQLKTAKAERTKLAKALGSRDLARARRGDQALGEAINAAKAALASDEEHDKERSKATKKATRQWSADFANLRSMMLD